METRICVICIGGLGPGQCERHGELWISGLAAGRRRLGPTFPSLDISLQASMTTGVTSGVHGIVSGGVFRRQKRELSFQERSNTLLSKKRFWQSRHLPRRVRAAMMFWSNPLAGGADFVLGCCSYGRPEGMAEQPAGLYGQLKAKLGPLDCGLLQGPGADWRASRWIASAAAEVWRQSGCDLAWVNLPGLEAAAVRHGPNSEEALEALRQIDALAAQLAQGVGQEGGQALVVGTGEMSPVSSAALPNARLVEAGLLQLVQTPLGQLPDLDRSRAFALCDHQIAHIYCLDDSCAADAADALRELDGVAGVLGRDELFEPGLGHDRSGELVALAKPDVWLAYPWWSAEADEPFAQAVALNSFGNDPCGFIPSPASGQVTAKLAEVRASRGLVAGPATDCMLSATCQLPAAGRGEITDLPEMLKEMLFAGQLAGAYDRT